MRTLKLLIFLGILSFGQVVDAQNREQPSQDQLNKMFEDFPAPMMKIPKVYVTADELANPDKYYARSSEIYNPPLAYNSSPLVSVNRPGEFEPMDSSVLSVLNYGAAYGMMWLQMLESYTKGGMTYIIYGGDDEYKDRFEDFGRNGDFDIDWKNVTWLDWPVDTIWIRDFGPEFSRDKTGNRYIFDANYSARPLDDVVPGLIAESDWISSDGSAIEYDSVNHMLSGGNIFTDGQGTCFFSDIVYGYEKPSSMTNKDVDDMMKDYLGCEQMIILNPICLDGTGHVDLYAKALGRYDILLGEFSSDTYFDGTQESGETLGHCSAADKPNDYQDQEDNLAILEATTNLNGIPWRITRLPMLEPYHDGQNWVYRSYMNSEIFNGQIAMPSYYDPQNDETADYLLEIEALAIAAYEEASPFDVNVKAIDADHIIANAGAFHCITHEIPAEFDYEYSEAEPEVDSGLDSGLDSGSDSEEDAADDGCNCNTAGKLADASIFSLLF